MQRVLLSAVLAVTVQAAPAAMAQEWGDLKLRFVYTGDPPKPDKIHPGQNAPFCRQQNLVDERLLVNQSNQGIKNVVVYVYTSRRGGIPLPAVHPDLQGKQTHRLETKFCRFDPHIVVMKQGDDLVVDNPDPIDHEPNVNTLTNPAVSFLLPAAGRQVVGMQLAEPAPVPVQCNIHPWMKAFVLVADNPYAAASDEDGNVVIKNLPAGGKLAFRIYHEAAGGLEHVAVGDELVNRRNVVELEISPGINDIGEVTLPADIFN